MSLFFRHMRQINRLKYWFHTVKLLVSTHGTNSFNRVKLLVSYSETKSFKYLKLMVSQPETISVLYLDRQTRLKSERYNYCLFFISTSDKQNQETQSVTVIFPSHCHHTYPSHAYTFILNTLSSFM